MSWTASASNGADVTGYRATASPGSATCSTSGATTCVIGGEAGVPYTVSVVALSAGGTSPASASSDSVIPNAPAVSSTPPVTDLPLDTGGGAISSAAPGQELVMVGTGYAPFSSVTIAVYSTPTVLATITADAEGSFRQAITVPPGLSLGEHSFVAAGVDSNGAFRALRLDITVAEDSGTDLPVTGAAVLWMVIAGFALTLIGVGLRSVRR